MADAETIARALGRAQRSGRGWLCSCPVPGHGRGKGDRTPSLLVADGDVAVLFSCFAGCSSTAVADEVGRRGLLDGAKPRWHPTIVAPAGECRAGATTEHLPDRQAVAIWRAAEPIPGTLSETYLAEHRGLIPPHPPTLRHGRGLLHPPSGMRLPALVAAIQAPDRRVVAIQATFLRMADGRKAPMPDPRLTTGKLGAGAVRLGPAGEVLGLAEGIEDALAAQTFTGFACWACLGSARMHRVVVPDLVREVHVFADADPAGEQAAERTAETHAAAGRRVVIHRPAEGFKDFADMAAERALA